MSERDGHRFVRVLSGRTSSANNVNGNGSSGPLPMLRIPETMRTNVVAAVGEFVGTFMFLFFSFSGTQIANTPAPEPGSSPNPAAIIFISLAFGVSLTANVWAFYRITGGLFNPCVTLALIMCGGLPLMRAALVIPAQLLAGIAAAGVVSALFPGPMPVDTLLGGGANTAQGLFIEMFLTAQLVFVILMLAVEKHRSTFLAPVGIGLTFFLCELIGVYFTGGSLNPARSLGPAVVNRSFPGYFWIYWLGPIMGTVLASGFYLLLKSMRYQECNPGQDSDGYKDKEEARPHPDIEHKAAPPQTP